MLRLQLVLIRFHVRLDRLVQAWAPPKSASRMTVTNVKDQVALQTVPLVQLENAYSSAEMARATLWNPTAGRFLSNVAARTETLSTKVR